MDDELSELLRSLKAAEDILQADSAKNGDAARTPGTAPAGRVEEARANRDEERRIALGDVAKAHKDYEREPFDRS